MHIYIYLGSEYTNLPQIIIPCKERAIFGIPSFLSFLITAFTFAFFLWCWRSIQMLGNLEEHSLAGLLSAQSKSGRGQQGSPSTATNDQTFRHDHLQKLTASSLVLDTLIYIYWYWYIKKRFWSTSQEFGMPSMSLSDCQSPTLIVIIQFSHFLFPDMTFRIIPSITF